eukprot:gene3977-5699_t
MSMMPFFSPYGPFTESSNRRNLGTLVFDPESDFGLVNNTTSGKNDMKALAPLMTADLVESDTDYHIHVDLPGVEDLDITIQDGFLTIKADRKCVHETNVNKMHSVERSYGKVQRSFSIPKNANVDNAEAKFKDGVLVVSFPKQTTGPAPRKLLVNKHSDTVF